VTVGLAGVLMVGGVGQARAQANTKGVSPTPSAYNLEMGGEPVASEAAEASSAAELEKKPKLTETTPETQDKFALLLEEQQPGKLIFNPLKYGVRMAVAGGVPANTIVFLLLFPLVAAVIAAARHIAGVHGYGIFLPAALSVVFVATGPVLGVALLAVILLVTTFSRMLMKQTLRLQYLPRLAFLVWFVSLGVLVSAMVAAALDIGILDISGIAIFPILVMILLTESFMLVQTGKSNREAMRLTVETVVLALVSYALLIFEPLQKAALLYPEGILAAVAAFNVFVGRYTGLRFSEYWKFRKLIRA